MKQFHYVATFAVATLMSVNAQSFCGFYVARADAKLYNQASQVVLVRDEDRTVLTMANDYDGDLTEFAMVVPVPTVLQREQINVGDSAVIDHIDAFTAPRLVEYFDADPCEERFRRKLDRAATGALSQAPAEAEARANSLGVTIEARYAVGEYDILILSATQSDGLLQWLVESGYRIPNGAAPIVSGYLKQDMRFFVAKVNIEKQQQLGFSKLRPLQIAYESRRFMLPIRLGMVNAKGAQELFIYTLTRTGRVETTNYRTVRLPTDLEVPTFVKEDFSNFYTSLFRHQTQRERGEAVFLEYAWDMGWCDPCAADPLTTAELESLGVFWLDGQRSRNGANNVFVTRLHARYDAQHFPEDFFFQTTGNRQNFQGRFIVRHPFEGAPKCEAAYRYYNDTLPRRQEQEARNLANITGWTMESIRARRGERPTHTPPQAPWWKKLWKKDQD